MTSNSFATVLYLFVFVRLLVSFFRGDCYGECLDCYGRVSDVNVLEHQTTYAAELLMIKLFRLLLIGQDISPF